MEFSKTHKIRYSLAFLFAIILLLGASMGASSNETAGSLTVEARDADGNLMTSGGIILYTEDWKVVGSKQLDSDGKVQWSNQESGKYHLELYRTKKEFWGSKDVTIPQDGNTEVTISRTEPRVTDLELAETTKDETYRVGESITISPKVLNDRSFPREVRVNISVDTNGDKSPETSVIRGPLEISEGGSKWYGYDYTPSTDGSVAISIIVESRIGDKWVKTDTIEWDKTFTVAGKETTTEQKEEPHQQKEEDALTTQQGGGSGGGSDDSGGGTGGSSGGVGINVILLTGIVVTMALVGITAASYILRE